MDVPNYTVLATFRYLDKQFFISPLLVNEEFFHQPSS